jgi:hypothetical protein
LLLLVLDMACVLCYEPNGDKQLAVVDTHRDEELVDVCCI